MLSEKSVIGVIHLPRIPRTTEKVEYSLEEVVNRAVNEARAFESEGFSGVIVENYGDSPYTKRVVDPLAIAAITVVVKEVVRSVSIDVGVNILRNSGLEAYSIAYATGARFVRVNALAETVVTDSGVLEPEAVRIRSARINYPGVRVYADILVKHGFGIAYAGALAESAVTGVSIEDYVRNLVLDYIERAGADALIVTGARTGEPPNVERLKIVKKFSTVPVLVGSGANIENVVALLKHSDGLIVGSYVRKDGKAGNPLDLVRLKEFARAVRTALV
ncbi:MAG: BtpA/SgcQ family protein [Sulfolobales archaeon]